MTARDGLFEVQGRLLIAALRRAGMDDPTIRQVCCTGAWELLLDLHLTEASRQEILGFLGLHPVVRSLAVAAAVQILTAQP